MEMLEPWLHQEQMHHVTVDNSFQLNVEDAFQMSEYDVVVFVDATKENISDFAMTKVIPQDTTGITTHSMSPGMLLHLCSELYGRNPQTYLLRIKGYQWELGDKLSEHAEQNLWKTFHFFRLRLHEWVDTKTIAR